MRLRSTNKAGRTSKHAESPTATMFLYDLVSLKSNGECIPRSLR